MHLFFYILPFLAISLWWGWPVYALIRKSRGGQTLHWSVSVMLQLTGVSALLGGIVYGIRGVVGGILFPPFWPLSASFFLQQAEKAPLPINTFFAVTILVTAVSTVLIFAIAGNRQGPALNIAILFPGCLALFTGLWAMNLTAQKLISDRATTLGATCLNSAPILKSIRDAGSGFRDPHATARLGNDILHWSYRQQDFYVELTLDKPKPTDWCPGY